MKLLVFTDLHIHNYKKFDNNGSRLLNCLKVLYEVFTYAGKHDIKYILFPGDLYDQQKSLPTEVVNMTIELFSILFEEYPDITLLAISGNHDHSSKNTLEHPAVTSLTHLHNIFDQFILIDDKSHQIKDGTSSVVIHGIPYYSHKEHFAHRLSRLSEIDRDYSTKYYLMIHQTPPHSNPMIPSDFELKDVASFNYVFCGHIHSYEQLSSNFVLVGSPLHRDLGDEGQDKGFLIFDTVTDTYERVLLDLPKIARSNEHTSTDYHIPVVEEVDSSDTEQASDIKLSDDTEELLSKYLTTQNLEEDQLLEYFDTGKKFMS